MSRTPVEIVEKLLGNMTDPDVVNELVAGDAVYVSLNTDDPELRKILPWAGTNHGPAAFTRNLAQMFRYWQNEKFEVTDIIPDGRKVAVFGDFAYRSNTLGKRVTSPFSILIKVENDQVVYFQFLEDTYATAASFRSAGSWTAHADPDGAPFEV